MKIQAWIEIGTSNIFHLLEIREQEQVVHELVFSFLQRKVSVRWFPKLCEPELFSQYFKFLFALCKPNIYPTRQQIERILGEKQLTVAHLFFQKEYGLYAQLTENNLDKETMESLAEILSRPLKQAFMEKEATYFLVASTEK